MSEERKVVLVGNDATGKTCLAMHFALVELQREYIPTVLDTLPVMMNLEGNKPIEISLWDTAGQSDYDTLRPLYYPGANFFFLVYSAIDPRSLENITDKWHPEVHYHVPDAKIVLVATKIDLIDDPETLERLENCRLKPVTSAQGAAVAKKLNAAFFETSSLTAKGCRDLFDYVYKYHYDLQAKQEVESQKRCLVS